MYTDGQKIWISSAYFSELLRELMMAVSWTSKEPSSTWEEILDHGLRLEGRGNRNKNALKPGKMRQNDAQNDAKWCLKWCLKWRNIWSYKMVTYHFISNKGQCLCCTCTNIMVISIKMRMGGNIWDGTQDTYVEFSCCGAAYCMVSMVKSPEPICALACYICRTASNNSCKSFFPNSYNLS